jgi:hypothetical protein
MGLEAHCTARFDGDESEGEARLEETALVFRGGFRLSIALDKITAAEAKRGVLEIFFDGSKAQFELGRDAEKWALKILYPRSRIDKLGVKPGARVSVIRVEDDGFAAELRRRTEDIASRPARDSDFIFYGVDDQTGLERLERLKESLKPEGAIWVVWRKGKGQTVTEKDVRAAAIRAGLVIPVALRKAAGRAPR